MERQTSTTSFSRLDIVKRNVGSLILVIASSFIGAILSVNAARIHAELPEYLVELTFQIVLTAPFALVLLCIIISQVRRSNVWAGYGMKVAMVPLIGVIAFHVLFGIISVILTAS